MVARHCGDGDASRVADEAIADKRRRGLSLSGYERDYVALGDGGRTFVDVSGASGLDCIRDARSGAALADLDNDGDLDVLRRASTGRSEDRWLLLFRNDIGNEGNSLVLELEGRGSGRSALGAVVRVGTSRGTPAAHRAAGTGFAAQWDPRLHFGLGDDEGVDWIEVTWPGGRVERLRGVHAGFWRVVEGTGRAERIEAPRGTLQ